MIVYDVATKELDTESFPQHTIADLNSGITFIVLFSQEKPLRWKEINTHTHTHTHTHCISKKRNSKTACREYRDTRSPVFHKRLPHFFHSDRFRWNITHYYKINIFLVFLFLSLSFNPRRSAGAKKILDILDNDTKANF